MAKPTLDTAIASGQSLLIDTSVALAYLSGSEPTSSTATRLFDDFVATGRNPASFSMVTVEEILVRPFRAGSAAVATTEGFLRHFADIGLVVVTYEIAREAARIRALTGLRTPDALVIASAVAAEMDVVVTNNRAWPEVIAAVAPHLGVCLLDDHAAG